MRYIDFHAVATEHAAVHARLLNWARWANGRSGDNTAPMFRMAQSAARVRTDRGASLQVDKLDALAVQGCMGELPADLRKALAWCYLRPVNPRRAAKDIGTTVEGLASLLHLARRTLAQRASA